MAAARIRKRSPRHAYEVRVKLAGVWVWRGTGTHDRTAALAWLREHERRAADPTYAAEATATLSGILSEYLASRVARGRAEGTLHHIRTKAGHLVRLLPAPLRDLTHRRMEAYIAQRRSEGAAQTTIKKELRVLGAALKLAVRNGRISRDPASILPELEDTYQPRTRALAPWELVALAQALPPHRAAHVVWICATGARWGESLRARRADVGPASVRLRGTKTRLADRSVPVLTLTRPMLAWAMERAPGTGMLWLAWSNVRRDLGVACRAAGIPAVTPNDLRRSLATWLRAAGVEPGLLALVLGHADGRMVERVYGRIAGDALRGALERALGTTEVPR